MQRENFIFLLVVLVTFSVLSISTPAQGVCPVRRFKLERLSGYVLDNGSQRIPVPETRVELLRTSDDELVKSVLTDARGFFQFDQVRKGEYRLRTSFIVKGNEIAPRFDVVVKVTKTNAGRASTHLEVRLGPDCFKSEAELKP